MKNRVSKILNVWMIAGPFFEPVEEANASLLWVAQRTGFPICGDSKEINYDDGGGYVDDYSESEKGVIPETQGISDHHENEGVLLVFHRLRYHNKMIRNFPCIIIIFQSYLAKKLLVGLLEVTHNV